MKRLFYYYSPGFGAYYYKVLSMQAMDTERQELFSFQEKCMEDLFHSYYGRLVAYASRIVGSRNVGADLVQDVFLKLWEKQPAVHVASIKSYIYIQTRNTCIMWLRRERIFNNQTMSIDSSLVENMYAIDFLEEAETVHVREQVLSDVRNFIDTLPPQTRNVFRLSRLENLSHRAIAEKLSISEKAVEKHITLALKRFKSSFVERLSREGLLFLDIFIFIVSLFSL